PATDDPKTRKLTFPLYGAMKGGSKFKLKTGTVGRLPPKRTDLPASLFIMKSGDEPEEEDEDEDHEEDMKEDPGDGISEDRPAVPETSDSDMKSDPATGSQTSSRAEDGVSREIQEVVERRARRPLIGQEKSGVRLFPCRTDVSAPVFIFCDFAAHCELLTLCIRSQISRHPASSAAFLPSLTGPAPFFHWISVLPIMEAQHHMWAVSKALCMQIYPA
ncbi:uncharacterized protein ACMZJ9_021830, partial [Mantella aurantiaca]